MLTPRRSAQLGLGGACLVLVSSVAVLVAGGSDAGQISSNSNSVVLSAPAVVSTLSGTTATATITTDKGTLNSASVTK
jgi:hypothetical protein